MKSPIAPFLELGFYFAQLADVDAFNRLVQTLERMGAKFADQAMAHRGEGCRDQSFAAIHDLNLEPVSIHNPTDFVRHLSDPDLRVVRVYMDNALGINHGVSEIVGYQSISQEAAGEDHHPLAIWTEGVIFSGPPSSALNSPVQEVGKHIYRRFCMLVEALKPSYAAITLEYDLECPADLRQDVRSLAFQNFFVSEPYVGSSNLKAISALFRDAYIEPIDDGLYISCTPYFNPASNSVESERAQWLSVEVARIIAAMS